MSNCVRYSYGIVLHVITNVDLVLNAQDNVHDLGKVQVMNRAAFTRRTV